VARLGVPLCALTLSLAPPPSDGLLPSLPSARAQGRAGNETEEEITFKKAEEQFNAGNYENAAELYDQTLKLNPTRVEAFVKRATLYFRERNYDKAIDLLTRAEKLSVSDSSIKTVLGLCLYESGQKERGLAYLEEVARQRPESHDAQFQIGKHYARLDPARASVALEQYFRLRPEEARGNDPPAKLFLATAYYLRGKVKEAQRLLEEALEARPRDNQIRQMLGTVLLDSGEYQRGIELYEPLLADVQRRPGVAFNLATAYLRMGKRDEARKLARQYQALRKEDPRALVLLGQIEAAGDKEPDLREALKRYQEAEALAEQQGPKPEYSSRVPIAAEVARVHLSLRDAGRAGQAADKGLSDLSRRAQPEATAAPSREEILLNGLLLESLLLQMNLGRVGPGNAPPKVWPLAEKLAQQAPSDAQVLALAGSGAYASGRFEQARRWFTDARQLDGKLPRARIGLARTLEQLAIATLAAAYDEPEGLKDREREKRDAARAQERTAALQSATQLVREAQRLDDSPSLLRNLTVVLLMQNNAAEAERLLTPALAASGRSTSDPAVPTLWRLQSRVQQALGRPQQAQEAAERAVSEAKRQLDAQPPAEQANQAKRQPLLVRLAEARIELGARTLGAMSETAGKHRDPKEKERVDAAVEALEQAVRDIGAATTPESKELLRAGQRTLTVGYLRRGRNRLQEAEALLNKGGAGATATKLAEDALEDLQAAVEVGTLDEATREQGHAECLSALAAAQAGQGKVARELAGKAKEHGCELVSPYNRIGPDLVSIFVQYRGSTQVAQREQLLRTLPKLQSKAGTGSESATLLKVLRTLLYSTNMALAYEYHQLGRTKLVGPALRAAQKAGVRGGEDDEAVLDHNLAVVDLIEGRPGGEKTLERLGARPPEALVNLGILHDRRGEARKALDLYRRALQNGARTPKLREWIDTKDRLLGSGGGS
jgi:tetratricopeptide (TPR) repeat protein